MGWKWQVLRVTTVRPCWRAVAAMRRSASLWPRVAERRPQRRAVEGTEEGAHKGCPYGSVRGRRGRVGRIVNGAMGYGGSSGRGRSGTGPYQGSAAVGMEEGTHKGHPYRIGCGGAGRGYPQGVPLRRTGSPCGVGAVSRLAELIWGA